MSINIKSFFGAQDMTAGEPLKAIMRFSIPLLMGNIAQVLYNTADSIIVGKLIGSNALASIGASAPIQMLFFVFFMTVGTGVTVVVSQYFGAKDYDGVSRSAGSAILLTAIAAAIITFIGTPLAAPILRATKVDDAIFTYANDYLRIMFLGSIGQAFYNILSGILRGLGESVFPLFVLLGTTVLNILLDLLFVGPLGLGVAGAAWATVISQIISALVCLIYLLKMRGVVTLNKNTLRPDKVMLARILRIGLPSGVQQGILSMSFVFVQSLINSIVIFNAAGVASYTIFVAANTAVSRLDSFAMLPNQAFSMAGSTFAGQNIGAGRFDRVRQGFKIILITSLIVSAAMLVFIYIFGGSMISMFIDTSHPDAPIIVSLGVRVQRIMVWCYLVMALVQAAGGVLRGAGDTLPNMWITIIATVAFRVPMAYILVYSSRSPEYPGGNPDGIFWSMVICFSLAAIASYLYYRSGKWKIKALTRVNVKNVTE